MVKYNWDGLLHSFRRCLKLERDVKQKRLLIEDYRQKLAKAAGVPSSDQDKIVLIQYRHSEYKYSDVFVYCMYPWIASVAIATVYGCHAYMVAMYCICTCIIFHMQKQLMDNIHTLTLSSEQEKQKVLEYSLYLCIIILELLFLDQNSSSTGVQECQWEGEFW